MAIDAFADALESIPRALATNAGFDGVDSLLKLVAMQSEGGENIGLNLEAGEPSDVVERGVMEPLNITRQAISGASEAAISILRIDDVLWATMEPEIPEEAQQRLQGFGAE